MASLNPKYVLLFTFQTYFNDKDTGLPLEGVCSFFEDDARSIPKHVFILSGTPGAYTYTDIGSEVDITNGVFNYLGNNIAIYGLPYENATSDVIQLYFYRVENTDGVMQFTREGQPDVFPASTTETVQDNYIPNGQFLLHNNILATPSNDDTAGKITEAITQIAPGGWTFERNPSSTDTDIITFESFPSPITNPQDNPRYYLHLRSEPPSSGSNPNAVRDICIKFDDVNRFSSDDPDRSYTYTFSAASNTLSDISIQAFLYKDYGTGGSNPAETPIGPSTITITPTWTLFTINFSFGTNSGKTIGTENDDFSQLLLRFPEETDIFLTDFGLFEGNVTNALLSFAPTTNRQALYQTLFQGFNYDLDTQLAQFPRPDGETLFLPLILTKNGIAFDDSDIGDIVSETQSSVYVDGLHPKSNRMLANGAQYETAEFSPLGIPYERLQAKYFESTIGIPRYGTGANYFTGVFHSTHRLIVTNNSPGAVTDAADGSQATGFTFSLVHKGVATYYTKAYLSNASNLAVFHIHNLQNDQVGDATAGDSGFSVSTSQIGNALLPQISRVDVTGVPTAGHYFTFESINAAVPIAYYVWYKVDGAGADPAPGGTGIKVDILSVDSAEIIAEKTREALNGWQVTLIETVAASAMTPNTTPARHFTINSTTTSYYVWYVINGVGEDPKLAGKTGIQVILTGSETATEVAQKTQLAINKKYFAVPDLRGYFLRGYSDDSGNDPDALTRWSLVPGVIGNKVGTFQLSENISHLHPTDPVGTLDVSLTLGSDGIIVEGSSYNVTTGYTGGREARPINMSVNFAIKY